MRRRVVALAALAATSAGVVYAADWIANVPPTDYAPYASDHTTYRKSTHDEGAWRHDVAAEGRKMHEALRTPAPTHNLNPDATLPAMPGSADGSAEAHGASTPSKASTSKAVTTNAKRARVETAKHAATPGSVLLPACKGEDQKHPDCYWDANDHGGTGDSFIVVNGRVHYTTRCQGVAWREPEWCKGK